MIHYGTRAEKQDAKATGQLLEMCVKLIKPVPKELIAK